MPRVTNNELWGFGIEHEVNFVKQKKRSANARITTLSNSRVGNDSLSLNGRRYGDWHVDPSVSGGLELVTRQWKRATVESIVSQIRFIEKVATRKVREANTNDVRIFPYGTNGMSTTQGMGSYHIGMSIPAKPSEVGERYGKKVVKFLKQLQWIEPLLISQYGTPRITSVGDYGDFSEGSERSTSTAWGNAGGTRVDNLLTSSSSRRYGGRSPKWRQKLIESRKIIISPPDGHIVSSGNTDIDTGEGNERTPLTSRLPFPPRVESRFMDSFDSSALPDLLKTIVYTASNSAEKNPDFDPADAPEDEAWNDAMIEVIEEGWNAYLPDTYIEKMRRNLKIPIATENRRADKVLEQVTKELWEKNKDTPLSKKMVKNNGTVPKHFSINHDAWNFFFARKGFVQKTGLWR